MAEYIDRWKLLKRISLTKCDNRTTVCEVCDRKEFCVYSVVEKFPAADVASVVHGRWDIYVGSDRLAHYDCSVCHEESPANWKYNYCPNCGAKMDLEV